MRSLEGSSISPSVNRGPKHEVQPYCFALYVFSNVAFKSFFLNILPLLVLNPKRFEVLQHLIQQFSYSCISIIFVQNKA